MRVFDIGPVMETIQQAISEGLEPDPALVNLLCEEGPKAIEQFWDCIDETQAEADLLAGRIKELQGRKAAREQTVERLKGVLQDVLARHFDGKVKTATLTTWNQETPSYQFAGEIPEKYYKTPDPVLKKAEMIEDYKAGKLPETVEVIKSVTVSPRVKR